MLGELPLEIYYGGSRVPSPGVVFTYRENPVLRAFEPLRSFVRCGLSLLPGDSGAGRGPHPTPGDPPRTPFCYFPGVLCPLGL